VPGATPSKNALQEVIIITAPVVKNVVKKSGRPVGAGALNAGGGKKRREEDDWKNRQGERQKSAVATKETQKDANNEEEEKKNQVVGRQEKKKKKIEHEDGNTHPRPKAVANKLSL
jgi:Tfp pilus assembly major pilin PilA